MWCRKLQIRNVGPFENFSVDFQKGLVGIFGPNGTGKSTILNLVYALLTNDYRRFDGVKMDNVRNTAPRDEDAFVAGEFEHGDHVLSIRHEFRPKTKVELIVDSDAKISDANKAQLKINAVLGVDSDMLDLYVFKTQDRVYDFLTTTPVQRAKAYQTLCRTQVCEDIHDYLGDFLKSNAEINAQVADNSDDLSTAIATLKTSSSEFETELKEQQGLLMNETSLNTAKEIIRKRRKAETLTEQYETEKAERKKLQGQTDQAFADLEDLKDKLGDAVAKTIAIKDEAEAAKEALKGWKRLLAVRKRRKELKADLDQIDMEARNNTEPRKPVGYLEDVTTMQETIAEQKAELTRAKERLKALRDGNAPTCPTCGTPVKNLLTSVESDRDTVRTYPDCIKAGEERIAASKRYDAALAVYEACVKSLEVSRKANKKQTDELEKVEPPKGDQDELQALVDRYVARLTKENELRDEVADLNTRHDRLNTRLQEAIKRCASLKEQLAENDESDERVAKAETRMAEHTTAANRVAALEGELRGTRRLIREKEDALATLRLRLKKGKKVRRQAAVVARSRGLFHASGLPLKVATANLRRMEGTINENLADYDDPFWVETGEELNFIVHKPGEPPMPARRLSTGWRVVLALAFWPAVASLWSQDLGMLGLDEPTANLDEDNRRFLSESLRRNTARVRGRRQILLVSHDHALRPAFDQVVDLGPSHE